MKAQIERWLGNEGIAYKSLSDLPSEYYADAIHPLKEGYARIAQELFAAESFREWIEKSRELLFIKARIFCLM